MSAGNKAIIETLSAHGADANLPANGGVTALHAAAEIGDLPTVKALLEASSLVCPPFYTGPGRVTTSIDSVCVKLMSMMYS